MRANFLSSSQIHPRSGLNWVNRWAHLVARGYKITEVDSTPEGGLGRHGFLSLGERLKGQEWLQRLIQEQRFR